MSNCSMYAARASASFKSMLSIDALKLSSGIDMIEFNTGKKFFLEMIKRGVGWRDPFRCFSSYESRMRSVGFVLD